MNLLVSRIAAAGFGLASMALLGADACWAGNPVPTPLVGVTGPAGIVIAGIAYGGYLLFRRFRTRD